MFSHGFLLLRGMISSDLLALSGEPRACMEKKLKNKGGAPVNFQIIIPIFY